MNDTVRRCLDDLESRIDPQEEEGLLGQWRGFFDNRFAGDIFSPRRSRPNPPRVDWPRVRINQALDDFDAMALQQYGGCSQALASGSGMMLNVRANYGSSIMPLLFGVKPFVMDDEFDTLPTSEPLNDLDAIQRLVDAGIPDINGGVGEKVWEMGRRYAQIAREYPKIGRYVYIYHPDAQGPMDICEVVWGSTIFYALYDRPELVHALLELVTQTYTRFMDAWTETVPFRAGGNAHWGFYHKGQLMLRDDSAMNLSADMFDEFIRPYDQRLLSAYGGGAIHFCGKGDHYMPRMTQMSGLHAIHMSQPECNNMEIILRHTVDQGIKVLGLRREVAERLVAAGRDLRGQVQAA